MRNITRHGRSGPETDSGSGSDQGSTTGPLSAEPLPVERARRSAKLLVSVRNAAESLVALRGGASFIDIKEPTNGSLGRASRTVQVEIVHMLSARLERGGECDVTVTAVLGELVENLRPESYSPVPGLSLYKLGLSGCAGSRNWTEHLDAWREHLTDETAGLAAVAYADHMAARAPGPREILDYAIDRRLPYLLIDTFGKQNGSLTALCGERDLMDLLDEAHRHTVSVALAGSLRLEDLPTLAGLGADVLAVRGAACRDGDRELGLDADRVRELAKLIRTDVGIA